MLYGRQSQQKQPLWKTPIQLNQLDHYLALLPTPEPSVGKADLTGAGNDSIGPGNAPANSPERHGEPLGANSNLELDSQPRQSQGTRILRAENTLNPGAALVVSNRSLARQGKSDAIAHYLSETLSTLGVAVQVHATVHAKTILADPNPLQGNLNRTQRLQITCESPYSLDPAVVAEPIAQRLRNLDLQDFYDAAVVSQVQGEIKPEWILRVDLTPPEEMLRELARWGDLSALRYLINQTLASQQVQVELELKERTLHGFCRRFDAKTDDAKTDSQVDFSPEATSIYPLSPGLGPEIGQLPKAQIITTLAPLLQSLAPQGIHAVMVYGLPGSDEVLPELGSTASVGTPAPDWVDWFGLPGAHHGELAPTPQELAEDGDLAAVAFLINRLLNPDLPGQLATGGIRVRLRQKGDLLHVMCDGPTCPRQMEVGQVVGNLVKQLRLPHTAGVRIYGRRAGEQRPLWTYPVDFIPRQRFVSEARPEFSASADHVGDLLSLSEEAPQELEEAEVTLTKAIGEVLDWGRGLLIRSQLCVQIEAKAPQSLAPSPQEVSPQSSSPKKSWTDRWTNRWTQSVPPGLVLGTAWTTLGVLLAIFADVFLGTRLLQEAEAEANAAPELTDITPEVIRLDPQAAAQQEAALPPIESDPFATLEFNNSSTFAADTEGIPFETDTFAETPVTPFPFETLVQATPLATVSSVASLGDIPDYPAFNNPLLDQKLALYQQYLLEDGPPDVLIMGSSRALRGIDPQVLAEHLQSLGYSELEVFNFAVNGSTAQVVDLQLRHLLKPNQLPQLVIWADGARAFNSGRPDITYNAIAASEGYEQIVAGTLPALMTPEPEVEEPQDSQYQSIELPEKISIDFDQWLTDKVGLLSSVYQQRERFKQGLNKFLADRLPAAPVPPPDDETIVLDSVEAIPDTNDPEFSRIPDAPEGEGGIQTNGFLPLSLQFNPATYYQKYARVQGQYDNDYKNFRLEGEQLEALGTLLDYLDFYQVPVVFVNLPLTNDYLDPVRRDYEEVFQDQMYTLMLEKELVFRELSELWPDEVGNFSDPSHLNRYGAYGVSIHLAEDPLIPWSEILGDGVEEE
jgi:hypothetical protein